MYLRATSLHNLNLHYKHFVAFNRPLPNTTNILQELLASRPHFATFSAKQPSQKPGFHSPHTMSDSDMELSADRIALRGTEYFSDIDGSGHDNDVEDDDDDSVMPPPTDPSRDFIINFFLNEIADAKGRTHADILRYNNNELEYHHDYIQLIFPLPEPSPITPDAPIINPEVRKAFLAEWELRLQLVKGLEKMLWFYGFALNTEDHTREEMVKLETLPKVEGDHDALIVRGGNFNRRADKTWLVKMDHNHLRISRIIRCLRVLGCEVMAEAFYAALVEAGESFGRVSSRTMQFWERAAKRPLWLPPSENDENARGVEWLKREFEEKAEKRALEEPKKEDKGGVKKDDGFVGVTV